MSRNRVANAEIAPYSSICLIEMYRVGEDDQPVTFVNRSTGFLIAPNVIVTAGHSLDEQNTHIYRLKIYPHQNSQVKSEEFLEIKLPDFQIRKVAVYNNPKCFVKDDFGIIFLKNAELPAWTSQHFAWKKEFYSKPALVEEQPIRIAGYPIDRPDFELWEESGGIVQITNRCVLHPFTTTKRNSGSPVWTTVDGQPRVVGIHVSGNAASCGAFPENRPFGCAALINERVFGIIENWIAEETNAANYVEAARQSAESIDSASVASRRNFLQKAGLAALGTSSLLAEPARKKELFVHHVFFYLKDPNNAQDEAKLLEGLQKLAKIPAVKFSHIGRPARTNGDEIEKGYSISWLCFFKNLIEEEIYQTDPVHLKFLEEGGDLWEKRVVYDALGQKG